MSDEREALARLIDKGMADRGRYVQDWPDDEAEAYREFGWTEGITAARALQVQHLAARDRRVAAETANPYRADAIEKGDRDVG
jgi:hypothetical protein